MNITPTADEFARIGADDDPQSKQSTLVALIDRSAEAANIDETLAGALAGYESTFQNMVRAWGAALDAGNSEADIRKALQADQKASGTKHFASSNDSGQQATLLSKFIALEGDLPEGSVEWVYRPKSTGATGLLDGQASVSQVITSVRSPQAKADIRAAGHGSEYGKGVVEKILAESSDKTDALVRLQQHARHLDSIVKEAKEAEKAPKDAVKYLKAASGPVAKAADEETPLGDLADVEALIESLRASLSVVEVRVAAARTAAAAEAAAE